MSINKETKIFCSFSKRAGNNGCKFFNSMFSYYDINAIYKSFSIENIATAVQAAKTLKFSGFAVSMPYKKDILNYVDEVSPIADEIGAANTVIINKSGYLIAHNTDYTAATIMLKKHQEKNKQLYVLGNGGLAAAVICAAKKLEMPLTVITRKEWSTLPKLQSSLIWNCTPVKDIPLDPSNFFADCNTDTIHGKNFSLIQANEQFKLYTNMEGTWISWQ